LETGFLDRSGPGQAIPSFVSFPCRESVRKGCNRKISCKQRSWLKTQSSTRSLPPRRPYKMHSDDLSHLVPVSPSEAPTYTSLPLPLHVLFKRDPAPSIRVKDIYAPHLISHISSLRAPATVIAGLHLLNDDMNACHAVCRANEGDGGCDTWHSLLHRRNGDLRNSCAWIGDIPSSHLQVLNPDHSAEQSQQHLTQFLDECEKLGDARSEGDRMETRQYEEMKRLIEWEVGKVAPNLS